MQPLVEYAAVILVRGDGRVLLGEQYPHEGWVLSAPGGGIEKSETPEQAAVRELREETGVEVSIRDLRRVGQIVHGASDGRGYRGWWFSAQSWTGEPTLMEPTKCRGWDWYPIGSPGIDRYTAPMLATYNRTILRNESNRLHT
ncbi:hypothetical protein GCM10009802_20390 [Streptomyces synnematoformans]|uniref:Nudix hydrolase domain-containing protein n=1 Tax=Streptomyces synnematoformans TaxID=415721 RepID=A0ABN2XXI2_9ACTN